MNRNILTAKVAIIGLGNIGKAIATNLIKGNHDVILASRDLKKSSELAEALGEKAHAQETIEAIKEADIIIPAIYFNKLKEFFQTYAKDLEGKTIVDVSNPIAPDENGGFKKIIGENESSGQILSELVPDSANFVKAFGTLGAGNLLGAAFSEPERKVLFYAAEQANEQVEKIIESSGFDPLYVGGLDKSIRIEVFGDLHEFGALGKPVTLNEVNLN